MQTKIPCVLMRGGTSKGPYFLATDLPADPKLRDQVLLAVMGSPDIRQIDGVGGADPLTSKVAIVSAPSTRPDCDVDYLFAQVVVDQATVDISPNCGNMLAGVGPFAIEQGLFPAQNGETVVRIHMVNSGDKAVARVQTPGGQVEYDGDARIDGVPGSAAPIMIDVEETAGSFCGALFPTGNRIDVIDGVECSLMDNGMPVVAMRAADLGRTGYETRDELNADDELKRRIEAIRLQAGHLMNLGDVTDKVVPKMFLLAPPRAGGAISTRSFIPKVAHANIGVLAAVTVATACVFPGTTAYDMSNTPAGPLKMLELEHPTGYFSVAIEVSGPADAPKIERAALLRTARRLFEGKVLIPAAVWDGKHTAVLQPANA
jgi:4-oxalomesaconate tautomerase